METEAGGGGGGIDVCQWHARTHPTTQIINEEIPEVEDEFAVCRKRHQNWKQIEKRIF